MEPPTCLRLALAVVVLFISCNGAPSNLDVLDVVPNDPHIAPSDDWATNAGAIPVLKDWTDTSHKTVHSETEGRQPDSGRAPAPTHHQEVAGKSSKDTSSSESDSGSSSSSSSSSSECDSKEWSGKNTGGGNHTDCDLSSSGSDSKSSSESKSSDSESKESHHRTKQSGREESHHNIKESGWQEAHHKSENYNEPTSHRDQQHGTHTSY